MPAACELHSWHGLSTASTSRGATSPYPFFPHYHLLPSPPSPQERCLTQFGWACEDCAFSDAILPRSAAFYFSGRDQLRWPNPWKSSNKSRPDLPWYSRTDKRRDDSFRSRKKRLLSSGFFYLVGRLPRLTFSVYHRSLYKELVIPRSNYTINIRWKWSTEIISMYISWTKQVARVFCFIEIIIP